MKRIKLLSLIFFMFIYLFSYADNLKKVKIFSFVEKDNNKIFVVKNDYSYGVIMSSYNLLKLMKKYEFEKPTIVNFNYPNYSEMIKNNKGYEFFIIGEYTIKNEEITFKPMIFNKDGTKLWETELKGTTEVDSLFEIADRIAVEIASFLTSKKVEIVKLKINITGNKNRTLNIEINGNTIFRNVGNGFVGIIPVVSDTEYKINVIDSNTEEILSTFYFLTKNKELESITIQNSEKVSISSEEIQNTQTRKMFLNISSGSSGMINTGVEYKLANKSFEFTIGTSLISMDINNYLKISFETGSRYNLWEWGILNIGIITKLYISYYLDKLRGIYLITGFGIDMNIIKLDIGITGGIVDFENFVYGPYWKINITL